MAQDVAEIRGHAHLHQTLQLEVLQTWTTGVLDPLERDRQTRLETDRQTRLETDRQTRLETDRQTRLETDRQTPWVWSWTGPGVCTCSTSSICVRGGGTPAAAPSVSSRESCSTTWSLNASRHICLMVSS